MKCFGKTANGWKRKTSLHSCKYLKHELLFQSTLQRHKKVVRASMRPSKWYLSLHDPARKTAGCFWSTRLWHTGIAKWRYHKKCVKSPGFKNSNISYKQVLDLTQGMSWLHFFLYVLCVSCLVQGGLFSSFPCARCVLLLKHTLELTCR